MTLKFCTIYLPVQLQNLRLNRGTDFNMHRLTTFKKFIWDLMFVVPCIMLYIGEISPTICKNCVFYSQWLYSTCFG